MKTGVQNILNLIVVFLILAVLTSGIDLSQFKKKIKKPKGVIIGLVCQFGILPITAFGVAYLLNESFERFSTPQGVALIILGSCPGGNVSNIFCFLWNADLSLSIAMTTASSILSFAFLTANLAIYIPILTKGIYLLYSYILIFAKPLNKPSTSHLLQLGSDTAQIDYISLAFSVGMVIAGICVGFAAAYYQNQRVNKALAFLGGIAVLYIMCVSIFGNATGAAPVWTLPFEVWLGPLLLCSVAWILSFIISLICGLPKRSILTVCFESANQNVILAATIIYLTLDEYSEENIDLAIGICITYSLICLSFNILGGLSACQLGWVNCILPDHEDYIEPEDNDDTVTCNDLLYKWKQNKYKRTENDSLTIDKSAYTQNGEDEDVKTPINEPESERANVIIDVDGDVELN